MLGGGPQGIQGGLPGGSWLWAASTFQGRKQQELKTQPEMTNSEAPEACCRRVRSRIDRHREDPPRWANFFPPLSDFIHLFLYHSFIYSLLMCSTNILHVPNTASCPRDKIINKKPSLSNPPQSRIWWWDEQVNRKKMQTHVHRLHMEGVPHPGGLHGGGGISYKTWSIGDRNPNEQKVGKNSLQGKRHPWLVQRPRDENTCHRWGDPRH